MGVNKLLRQLYNNQAIPEGTDRAIVTEAWERLCTRLSKEMSTEYRWFAACTVAVEAGCWGGRRRLERRKKLLRLINQCEVHMGMAPTTVGEKELSRGLYYGYGATSAYARDRDLGVKDEMFLLINAFMRASA